MKNRWRRALLSGALALAAGASAAAQEYPGGGMPYPMPPGGGMPYPMPPGGGMPYPMPHGIGSAPCPEMGAPPCDPGCGPICPQFWVRMEYLLWEVRGMSTPPLVTTGPIDVVGFSGFPGVLGQPTTQVLLGAESLDFDISSGGRATVGWWFDCNECLGVEASYLELAKRNFGSTFASAGTPGTIPLSVPYFDLLQGFEDSVGVALPGPNGFSGSASTFMETQVWAAEVNGLLNFISKPGWRVNLIGGARYMNLRESLTFITQSTLLPPANANLFTTLDNFECENTFYGGQIGLRGDFRARLISLELTGKVALGQMERETTIVGQFNTNNFTDGASVQSFASGYFAQPTNIGYFKTRRFATVSEATAQIGWHPWECLRLFAGYTMLYATHVARPGDQMSRTINVTQSPAITGNPNATLQGPAAPVFRDFDASWWAQGVNLGLEFRF